MFACVLHGILLYHTILIDLNKHETLLKYSAIYAFSSILTNNKHKAKHCSLLKNIVFDSLHILTTNNDSQVDEGQE